MGIQVGIEIHPIEIVVTVDIRIGLETQFVTPALEKASPEEVADGNPIALLVVERHLHSFQLRDAIVCAIHRGAS